MYSTGLKVGLLEYGNVSQDMETAAEHKVSGARRHHRYNQKHQEIFAILHTPIGTAYAFFHRWSQIVAWTRTSPRFCRLYSNLQPSATPTPQHNTISTLAYKAERAARRQKTRRRRPDRLID